MTRLQECIHNYGSAGRYVFALERELDIRKTRQSFIMASLGLNVILVVAVIYLMVAA